MASSSSPPEPDPSTFLPTVGGFPKSVHLRGRVPRAFRGAHIHRLLFLAPSGRKYYIGDPAVRLAAPGDLLPFDVVDEDVPMDTTVPTSWQIGDKVTTRLKSGRILEILAPEETRPGVELEFTLPLSELVAEFDGAELNVEEIPPAAP
eukprot:scaffold168145_cov15-Tisochrysis_lutea.AAC.1